MARGSEYSSAIDAALQRIENLKAKIRKLAGGIKDGNDVLTDAASLDNIDIDDPEISTNSFVKRVDELIAKYKTLLKKIKAAELIAVKYIRDRDNFPVVTYSGTIRLYYLNYRKHPEGVWYFTIEVNDWEDIDKDDPSTAAAKFGPDAQRTFWVRHSMGPTIPSTTIQQHTKFGMNTYRYFWVWGLNGTDTISVFDVDDIDDAIDPNNPFQSEDIGFTTYDVVIPTGAFGIGTPGQTIPWPRFPLYEHRDINGQIDVRYLSSPGSAELWSRNYSINTLQKNYSITWATSQSAPPGAGSTTIQDIWYFFKHLGSSFYDGKASCGPGSTGGSQCGWQWEYHNRDPINPIIENITLTPLDPLTGDFTFKWTTNLRPSSNPPYLGDFEYEYTWSGPNVVPKGGTQGTLLGIPPADGKQFSSISYSIVNSLPNNNGSGSVRYLKSGYTNPGSDGPTGVRFFSAMLPGAGPDAGEAVYQFGVASGSNANFLIAHNEDADGGIDIRGPFSRNDIAGEDTVQVQTSVYDQSRDAFWSVDTSIPWIYQNRYTSAGDLVTREPSSGPYLEGLEDENADWAGSLGYSDGQSKANTLLFESSQASTGSSGVIEPHGLGSDPDVQDILQDSEMSHGSLWHIHDYLTVQRCSSNADGSIIMTRATKDNGDPDQLIRSYSGIKSVVNILDENGNPLTEANGDIQINKLFFGSARGLYLSQNIAAFPGSNFGAIGFILNDTLENGDLQVDTFVGTAPVYSDKHFLSCPFTYNGATRKTVDVIDR